MGSVKNATQFTWSLLNIAPYMQMKCNNEMGEAIRTHMTPMFTYLGMPQETKEVDKNDNKY